MFLYYPQTLDQVRNTVSLCYVCILWSELQRLLIFLHIGKHRTNNLPRSTDPLQISHINRYKFAQQMRSKHPHAAWQRHTKHTWIRSEYTEPFSFSCYMFTHTCINAPLLFAISNPPCVQYYFHLFMVCWPHNVRSNSISTCILYIFVLATPSINKYRRLGGCTAHIRMEYRTI